MRITEIPKELDFLLTGDHVLRFHSHYHRTVNYILDGSLVSLQSAGTQPTPISICTDVKDDELSLTGNNDAVLSDGVFTAGQLVLTTDKSVIYSSVPRVRTAADAAKLRQLELIADGCEKSHADVEKTNVIIKLIYDTIEEIGTECLKLFSEENYSGCSERFAKLIGTGQGLTPSGDDFIIGVMALLSHIENEKAQALRSHMAETIGRQLEKTNDISARFLLMATRDRFSRYVLDMLESALTDGSGIVTDLVNKVAETGHSSGLDLLMGVKWACKALITGCGD